MPEGIFERVEDDLQSQKEEAERESAKARAKDNGGDSANLVPA
jgi:C4-type Zn-finger protein